MTSCRIRITPATAFRRQCNCPWACDSGYGLTDVGTCELLCATGIKILRTNSLVIPLYASKETSPALAIETSAGICYASLAPGEESGAINISYSGNIYHTIR